MTTRASERAMAAAKGKGKLERSARAAAVAAVEASRAAIADPETVLGIVRGNAAGDTPLPERLPAARALPKVHRVKSWPESFRAVVTGRKRFEMRRDDRNYQPGDTIELREYVPNLDQLELVPGGGQPGQMTGRSWMGVIGYVSRGGPLPAGWCAFDLISVEDINRVEGVRR